jgi:hypothetical protein
MEFIPDAIVNVGTASMFGAFELIVMAAFYIFKLEFVKPRR